MSAEEITELRRLNDELKADKEAAVKRAAKRHREMMHANRRAERAENALRREAWERLDDQMKTTKLFRNYKETIKILEADLSHKQRSEHYIHHIQTLQAANAGLETALLEQKQNVARHIIEAEEHSQQMQVDIETEKDRVYKDTKAHYEGLLAKSKKQFEERASRTNESHTEDVNKLKKQLQEAVNMIDWHRKQAQHHIERRPYLQTPQQNTGTFANSTPPSQQSPAKTGTTAIKRKKSISTR
ncbi:hypothetical protein N0V94_000533 [Neodidymelliopsis sp. IMI 364377]|nr:hypothetical protein N0V94_000533 [Neodidymelliopsis sp. IMI 364377]